MSIMQRINDLLQAEVHHRLDQVEEPERMVQQILREMDGRIREAKRAVVNALAGERRLFGALEEQRSRAVLWAGKAELTLRNGREELARTALGRKLDYERIAAELEPSWAAARRSVEQLKEQLRALEAKRAELYRNRIMLVARERAAKAQLTVSRTTINVGDGLETEEKFARMEERVRESEARAQAAAEILEQAPAPEQTFQEMETELQVEHELAALKEKIKIYPSRGEW